jgi:hypothetical protein
MERDLSPEATAGWREICNWALKDPALAYAVKEDWLGSEMGDAVALMVYVRRGRPEVPKTWPHAPLLSDVIDRWGDRVGHNPYPYNCLITMLEGPGWNLTYEPALGWLSRIASASPDLVTLSEKNDNGQRTAELLQRMYNEHQAQLRENPTALERCSRLIEVCRQNRRLWPSLADGIEYVFSRSLPALESGLAARASLRVSDSISRDCWSCSHEAHRFWQVPCNRPRNQIITKLNEVRPPLGVTRHLCQTWCVQCQRPPS